LESVGLCSVSTMLKKENLLIHVVISFNIVYMFVFYYSINNNITFKDINSYISTDQSVNSDRHYLDYTYQYFPVLVLTPCNTMRTQMAFP